LKLHFKRDDGNLTPQKTFLLTVKKYG
jgi:hypothetical protein